MAKRLPNSPQPNQECRTLSELVNQCLKENGETQADLVKKSSLSKTTVSRICRDSDDRGSTYRTTPAVVMALCIGLGKTGEAAQELFYAAFPEWRVWNKILKERLKIDDANMLLYEQGLPLLGNNQEE